jgi:phospholipid transport system substrate-binding protein
MPMVKYVFLWLVILIAVPSVVWGDQPLEVLQKSIEQGIRILKDPQYKDTRQKELQQEKLWEILQHTFNFTEFSKRVLASSWSQFTYQQRVEFTYVFSKFLKNFYLTQLQEKYKDESVIYLGQKIIGKSEARVQVKVLWNRLEVPVEIFMAKHGGTWKVYNINILGISAVKNYRAQFQVILLKDTPDQVIQRLKNKIRHQEQKLKKDWKLSQKNGQLTK